MSKTSSSTALADALSLLSRTTHKVVADVETRSRTEVAGAIAETSEARTQRDKALKELQNVQAECQAWKEEANASKAALGQAELTIAHQTDIVTQQCDTIAQLRREVSQLKDQSRNWQDHFLRVEQERCSLSSRIDELLSERLQWSGATPAPNPVNPYTPQSRYISGQANSSHTSTIIPQLTSHPSPTLNTSSKSKPVDRTPIAPKDAPTTTSSSKPRKPVPTPKQAPSNPNGKARPAATQHQQPRPSTTKASKVATPVKAESTDPAPAQLSRSTDKKTAIQKQKKPAPGQTTLIRRVQAVVTVKHEEESEEEVHLAPSRAAGRKAKRPAYLEDSDLEEEEDAAEIYKQLAKPKHRPLIDFQHQQLDDEGSKRNGVRRRRSLRPGKQVQYQEEDNGPESSGESSEEDELTMGNESSRSYINQRTKPDPSGSPAKKKRKTVS